MVRLAGQAFFFGSLGFVRRLAMTKPTAILSLVLLAAHFAIPPAAAQYPAKPIHLIVPAAPGGGTDIAARSFVPALQDNLGQPVVIENRGGAGGIIGTDAVAKAAPDGYTLLLCYVSHATNPTLAAKLPYDTLRDFAPITLIAHEPTVLVTHPSVPASTLAEFIAYARERPGKLFKQATGMTSIEYVAYKGSGPAAADVVAGHLPYMWSVISIVTPFIKAGRLKGLAIAAERRAPNLPEVPTTAEAGLQDFQVSGWYGLLAPAKTTKAVIDRVHAAAAKALQNEAVLARLATSGSLPIGAGPEQLDAHIRREIARWEKVLKAAGVELK